MLEARAAAGRAAAVAGVEAEHAGAVAALLRLGQRREQLAHRVEGADIAGRVGARGLADRALVDEDRVGELLGAEQAVVLAGRFGRLAEMACQRRRQHVLDQRRLARAAHAGDADQPLQRELDGDVLQVVLARALQDQPRRAVEHRPRQAQADGAPRAEVGAGQRLGAFQLVGRAVEDDAPALGAGAGAEVDDAVGRQHHRRVVLDDHQRVAGVAQPRHRLVDAVHVARVQADGGLVQHEERVHQRRAQRGGQVDALHLAAGERAALAVQRQIAQADVAEVFQPVADLVLQQLQRVVEQLRGQGERVEELPQPRDRHQHQVVQAQSGQALQLLARPGHAGWQEALRRRQHRIGLGLLAQAPEQRFQLEPRAAAGAAGRVAAVLRQEHADVHLVGLALEVLEEAADAVPVRLPVAVPVRRAVDDPGLLRRAHLVPCGVARDAGVAGAAHQVGLALGPGRRLQRLDRAAAQRLAPVRNHQPEVHADHPPEAAAGLAGAVGRVEREHRRLRMAVAAVGLGAVQALAVAPELILRRRNFPPL